MDRDAGAGVVAEVLDLVGRAVAVLVAQRRDAAPSAGLAQRDVDVAIVAHRDVPRPPDAVGEHPGVKSLGYADAGVLVHRRPRRARAAPPGRTRAAAQGERTQQRPPEPAPACCKTFRALPRVPSADVGHDPPTVR